MFSRHEMRESIAEFLPFWDERPFKPNPGGMEINHSWATWFILRTLRPTVVVESGVFRGHSTWLIENTLPDCSLFSFDPHLGRRKYVSKYAVYCEHDLVLYDWTAIPKDHSLVFLDDHQDALARLKDLYWLGFKRIIFEDVYPLGSQDHYDLNALRSGSRFPVDQASYESGSQSFRRIAKRLLNRAGWHRVGETVVPRNNNNWVNAKPRIKMLLQMPPIQRVKPPLAPGEKSREPQPLLLDSGEIDELEPFLALRGENRRYNSLTYVELI